MRLLLYVRAYIVVALALMPYYNTLSRLMLIASHFILLIYLLSHSFVEENLNSLKLRLVIYCETLKSILAITDYNPVKQSTNDQWDLKFDCQRHSGVFHDSGYNVDHTITTTITFHCQLSQR